MVVMVLAYSDRWGHPVYYRSNRQLPALYDSRDKHCGKRVNFFSGVCGNSLYFRDRDSAQISMSYDYIQPREKSTTANFLHWIRGFPGTFRGIPASGLRPGG